MTYDQLRELITLICLLAPFVIIPLGLVIAAIVQAKNGGWTD